MTPDAERLGRLLDAAHPGVRIVTHDEPDAVRVVRAAADARGAHAWVWSLLDGVRPGFDERASPIDDTHQPAAALYWLARQQLPCLHVLLDLAPHLEDPHTLRALRSLLGSAPRSASTVVLIDHHPSAPPVVRAACTPFELTPPDSDEISAIVRDELRALHKHRPIRVEISKADYAMVLKNLRGLSRAQVAQVIRDVVAEDRVLDTNDLNAVMAIKRRLLSDSGPLEYVQSPATLHDVGGLDRLKAWLERRRDSFSEEAAAFGLVPPRGLLILGVQGAGKSLCAKAIATAWQRPLLKLDPGSLYDRYVGESEKRLRDALRQARAMAPVVLWIDEIEKGFASAAAHSTDGGLSQRMFGTLLTWMNDHTDPVFMVATANNIEALPPELLRKGRFDEVFFVDLPGQRAREAIFRIHLAKRRRDPAMFNLFELARAAEGFSGAEIEAAVLSAMHSAYAAHAQPSTATILEHIAASPPLSVTRAEQLNALRHWARGRCVPAD